MWAFIIGFIVIVGIIVVVTNRRGSTGASRADDLPSRYTATSTPRRPRCVGSVAAASTAAAGSDRPDADRTM